ncbi:MAG: hypothetical protein JSS04_17035 [Proteobacteria bacterium]|nr:hypothetical protein [Pseudomonadota bacterium]
MRIAIRLAVALAVGLAACTTTPTPAPNSPAPSPTPPASPATPPAATPHRPGPPPVAGTAMDHVAAAERPFIQSLDDARTLQQALGARPDGDLGPAGAMPPGETRRAIAEFQTGLNRRRGDPQPGRDVIEADDFRALVAGGAMPADFRSAFERGLLGDRIGNFKAPSATAIGIALGVLGAPVPPADATLADRLALLRRTIAAKRTEPGSPPPLGRADALDSALFDVNARRQPTIPQPTQ